MIPEKRFFGEFLIDMQFLDPGDFRNELETEEIWSRILGWENNGSII